MPDFWTHNFIGEELIKKIEPELLNDIDLDHFYLGCQGPDIFFYRHFSIHTDPPNLGELIHNNKIIETFESAIDYIIESDSKFKFSYLCGWILHYVVDKNCHPYINSKDYDHKVFEADIDTYLINKFRNKSIFELKVNKIINNKIKINEIVDIYSNVGQSIFETDTDINELKMCFRHIKKYQKIFKSRDIIFRLIIRTLDLVRKKDYKKFLYRSYRHIEIPNDIDEFEKKLFDSLDEALDIINTIYDFKENKITKEEVVEKFKSIDYTGKKIVSN